MAMHAIDNAAQARGYAFERFLKTWFDAWGLEARRSFKLVGEQIDGSFLHHGSVYLIEAKWRNAQTNASSLRAFQEMVGDEFEGSRGLFISYSGFTAEGLQAFTARRVVMMDGRDVDEALRRRISLEEDVVAAKLQIAVEERRPFVHVRELFLERFPHVALRADARETHSIMRDAGCIKRHFFIGLDKLANS